MKLGEHYLYIDRSGKKQESIWIKSALDIERYFNKNVLSLDGERCLVRERNFTHLWSVTDERVKKLITVPDEVRFDKLFVKAKEACKVDPDFVEFLIPSEYQGDSPIMYTEEDEEHSYAGGLPTIAEINREYYNLTPNGRTMNALLDHLNRNIPDIALSQNTYIDPFTGQDYGIDV